MDSYLFLLLALIVLLSFSWVVWQLYQRKYILSYFQKQKDDENSKFIVINHLQIHYKQIGSGNPHLVLIHGIGASLYIWRFVTNRLKSKYRITILDLPGFGLSQKDTNYSHSLDAQTDTIISFLDALGISKCYLVGSSMGGAISLWMTKKYPERFPYVIGCSPAANPKLTGQIPLNLLFPFYKTIKHFLNESSFKQILKLVVNKKSLINKESIKAYLKPYTDNGDSIKCFTLAFENLLKDNRLPQELSTISSNVLLIWGKKDRLTPIKYSAELQKLIPKSKLMIHPTASHHMMEEEPEWLCQQIDNFLK